MSSSYSPAVDPADLPDEWEQVRAWLDRPRDPRDLTPRTFEPVSLEPPEQLSPPELELEQLEQHGRLELDLEGDR